jgi:SAM-dependent methyltransferase
VTTHSVIATRPAARHYAERSDAASQSSPIFVRVALAETLPLLDDPVLDVGSGVGANLAAFAEAGRDGVGTDVAITALRDARAFRPVAASDGARLPFAGATFGGAVCTEVLEHVDDPAAVFAEISRVLRPGALLYVTVPNSANLAGLHTPRADRRSGGHDWNPWGAHEGGYEAFMTGHRAWMAARQHFDLERVRALDYGQAITGRFGLLDRAAWSRPGRRVLTPVLDRLERSEHRVLAWHGMHTELLLRRRGNRP